MDHVTPDKSNGAYAGLLRAMEEFGQAAPRRILFDLPARDLAITWGRDEAAADGDRAAIVATTHTYHRIAPIISATLNATLTAETIRLLGQRVGVRLDGMLTDLILNPAPFPRTLPDDAAIRRYVRARWHALTHQEHTA